MRLSQRAPYPFRRIGDLAFDDDGACFGRGLSYGFILHFFERAGRVAAGFEIFSATAARMSAFSASSSIGSPSRMSIARRVEPSRLELKRREGSSSAAPLVKV